jgi:NitT/TauT family transport system substrate-binding protein
MALEALAACQQGDRSAIAVRADSGINSPKDLVGKTIGYYGTYFEQDIFNAMIRHDGGVGDFKTLTPGKLNLWQLFLDGKVDAAWMFPSFEGVLAGQREVGLRYFKLQDYGVPYGQSPIMMIRKGVDHTEFDTFLAITGKGYQEAANNPIETASLLHKSIKHPNWADLDFAELSLIIASTGFLDADGKWGTLDADLADRYGSWLTLKGLVRTIADFR